MPGVIAFAGFSFLAAIGVGAASAAVIMSVGAAAIVLTVASVRRASQLKDSGEVARPSGTTASFASTEMPAIIAFGETLVGGCRTYFNSTGTELRELYYEIVHTGHEIDSYIGWYLDDRYVPIADVDSGGDGSVDGNTGGHDLDDVSGTPTLYLRGALGTDSQAVDSMLDTAFAEIDTNHRHRGCARSVIRCDLLQGHEDKWNGRPPDSITAVIRAMKCYDPRADGTFAGGVGAQRLATPSTWTWTDCPALIWARYRILGAPLGPSWATDRIDWQSVFDAANVCDALVAVPTAATEKRFRCDLVTDSAVDPSDVVPKILATMAGKERHFNGLWHVYAAVWPSTDFALTDDDLIGEVQYRKQPEIGDRYNQIKGTFIDRERLWKPVQFVSVNNTTLRTNRDNGKVLPRELALDGVTREYQAQRLAMHALNHADDTGVLIFPTGYNGLNIRVGDSGTVTLSEFGWVAKTFRCVATRFIEFQGMELTLKEDASGNYSDPLEASYSTRTAAGDIVFGTVNPWYLAGPPGVGWAIDTDGKPAGVRGNAGIADRSQLSLLNGRLRVTSSPDSDLSYALLPALVTGSKEYRITVRWASSTTSADGLWFWLSERNSALPAGKTHVGVAATGESVVGDEDSHTNLVADAAFPGTTFVERTFFYTAPSSARLVSLGFQISAPATAGVALEVEWVGMFEVGSNVNLLPGVRPPINTPDLALNAAEELAVSQPTDGTEVIGFISYSGGGTLVDYSTITSASWANDTGESIDVMLRQSARVQLTASDSLIGRKLAIRWRLSGGAWSYDGTSSDNVNITAADYQPKSTQRTVTVAVGETIEVESIVVLIIPDPTTGDPADVAYRGLSLSIEAKKR